MVRGQQNSRQWAWRSGSWGSLLGKKCPRSSHYPWFICIYNLTVKSSTQILQEPECLPTLPTFEAINYSEQEVVGSREALSGQWSGKKGKQKPLEAPGDTRRTGKEAGSCRAACQSSMWNVHYITYTEKICICGWSQRGHQLNGGPWGLSLQEV